MAVALNSKMTTDVNNFTSGSTDTTLTIVTGNGNRLLLVKIIEASSSGTFSASAITWGGVSLTQIGTNQTATNCGTVIFYGLLNPATGTGPLAITYTTDGTQTLVMAECFDGVLQTSLATALTNFTANSGGPTTTSTVTVTTASGNAVSAVHNNIHTGGFSAASAVQEFVDNATTINSAGNYVLSTSSTATLTGTLTSDNWLSVGVNIVAAGAPPDAFDTRIFRLQYPPWR